MPLDAVCLQGVVTELAPLITGSRIEKIQQPARDQIILLLRGSRRLLLSASGGQPRLHLTETLRDNPAQPPMFCMLLRKYLSGGIIEKIEQIPLERVVKLTISAADELGERSRYFLLLEAFPRRANLILTDKNSRILDCLRRIDFEMNQERQVLPGLFYRLPATPDKLNPFTVEMEEFYNRATAAADTPADEFLVNTFNGMPPLVARELAFRGCGSVDTPLPRAADTLWAAFSAWRDTVNENDFTPVMLKRIDAPMDFSYMPIAQYGAGVQQENYSSFSALLDDFYAKREQAERVKQKGQDLLKTANNAAARLRRKIVLQEKELLDSKDRDKWRIYGELITANLYRMERGMRCLTAQNYYDPECKDVNIPLDVKLSPQENAAKYFKKYTKAKAAEKHITQQLEMGRAELQYLESVLQELTLAESEQDFNDIRSELIDGGYLRSKGKKQSFQRPSKPREFLSTNGLRILVGRNNRQNDRLTTKDAEKWDLWFHTQRIHGSHVILSTGGAQPDEESIAEAASLAAYFSQAQGSTKVPVDYTPVKYVKKPAGAKPGMVVYTTYKTMLTDPDEKLVKRLENHIK